MKALDKSRSASAGAAALLSAVGAAVAALAACAPAAGAPATRPAGADGEAVARLYAVAVVTDDDVRLSDVAELDSEQAGLAGNWVVAAAPPVGGTRVIDLEAVQRALAHQGANLSRWVFRGSSRCTVSRPKSCIRPADLSGHGGSAREVGQKTRVSESGRTATAEVDPNSLEAELRTHIEAKALKLGGAPVIRFSPAASKALALARPQYSFRIVDRSTGPLGMVPLEVEISEQGKVVRTLPMLVHVLLRKPVVVAARPINGSQRIEPDDLVLSERTFERIEDIGMSDMGPLVGQQAKRPIARGDSLSTKDVEPVPLIQRNDLVTVWVRRGGISVKGAAKAMETKGYGETVLLKNEASRQEFAAVVTGPRTAEVTGEAAGVSPTAKERTQ